MLDFERQLVEAFHWSLYEIDNTDIESLLAFVFHLGRGGQSKTQNGQRVYADQVDWL
jgi:hypothetical protein